MSILDLLSVSSGFATVAALLAIAATVLAFVFIVPEKRREKLNAFGKFLHDTCNFKYLVVEKLLQALYIFSTALVILNGFFLLFQSVYGHWLGGYGILIMVVGPIVLRLLYELLMMMVLLVKNVIGINNKLKNQNGDTATGDVFAAPDVSEMREVIRQRREAATQAPAAPQSHFCTKCGSPLDEAGNCPNCTKE